MKIWILFIFSSEFSDFFFLYYFSFKIRIYNLLVFVSCKSLSITFKLANCVVHFLCYLVHFYKDLYKVYKNTVSSYIDPYSFYENCSRSQLWIDCWHIWLIKRRFVPYIWNSYQILASFIIFPSLISNNFIETLVQKVIVSYR